MGLNPSQYNLVGAGVSAGGGLLSSLVSGIFAGKQQKRQYQYNTMLQQQAAQLEQNSWLQQYERMFKDQLAWREDERAYNTPSAQMARLKEAGINPTFGNGGINTGNYSLNPEMPGTAAGVGSPGVGAPMANFANPLGDAVQYSLEDRRVKALEREVGIKDKLSDAEIDQMGAKTKELLSQEGLNQEQKKQVTENINLIRSQVIETGNRAEAILVNSLLDTIRVNQQQQYNSWLHQYQQDQSAIGFIEAHAAKMNAQTAQGQLELAKEKWRDELKLRERQLDNESERLLQSFEKNGYQALEKAIDEASLHFKIGGLAFTYTSPDDLVKQTALVSACTRYFENLDMQRVLDDNKGWTLSKGLIDCYQKFQRFANRVSINRNLQMNDLPNLDVNGIPSMRSYFPPANPKIGE